MQSGRPAQRGLAYLVLLLAIAIIGAATASSVNMGARRARADAEDALLEVGAEFERALTSYRGRGQVNATGGGPKTLEDLLKDSRTAGVRRHLRAIRPDPLTGKAEWGVQRYPDGSIAAVYSLAGGEPIKRTGFAVHQGGFDEAATYTQWMFSAVVEQAAVGDRVGP